jgi:hypothetical protein
MKRLMQQQRVAWGKACFEAPLAFTVLLKVYCDDVK